MGDLGGLLGLRGGSGGTGFNANNSGTNQGQINTAYGGVQNSLQSQQALLQALQNQKGLQNQSNVYGQLQGVANGTGPNPAQTMLAQATGQNVANQAALMAGQRGAAANPGLIARQAAQQGANLQQQAAGQGASMQAQQSLAALGQMGNLANTMAGQQIGQTNMNTQANMGEQGQLLSANAQNNAVQGQLANTQMQGGQGMIGGLLQGGAAALGMAKGGEVHKYAMGDMVQPANNMPQSDFAKFLMNPQPMPNISSNDQGAQQMQQGFQSLGQGIAKKNKSGANANLGAGQAAFSNMASSVAPEALPAALEMGVAAAHGGNIGDKLKSGGHVPGQAKVKGDNLKNDTVKAMLSPGEIVIPRSVTMSKDPVRGAAQFVSAVLAKKKARGK